MSVEISEEERAVLAELGKVIWESYGELLVDEPQSLAELYDATRHGVGDSVFEVLVSEAYEGSHDGAARTMRLIDTILADVTRVRQAVVTHLRNFLPERPHG